MKYVEIILRVLLGALFVLAACFKLLDLGNFYKSITYYQLLPLALVLPMTYFLPVWELTSGLLLMLGKLTRGALLSISIMLLVFIGALVAAWVRGLDISCGCFGSIDAGATVIDAIIRDIVMLAVAIFLFTRKL